MRYSRRILNDVRVRLRGLTLFELLVVLAILAFLSALVAPRIAGYLGRAKSDIARTQASNIATSLELFFLDYDRYPSAEEGLIALVSKPPDADEWNGPYLKDPSGLSDPWGREYRYLPTNDLSGFEIISLGRDGLDGGSGEDSDIHKQ